MKLATIFGILTIFLLGCNNVKADKDQKNNHNQTNVTEQSAADSEALAIDDQLPEATLMRVELDNEGNPIAGTEELRTVSKIDASTLAESFEQQSAAPKAGSYELDADSSTQSWYLTQLQNNETEGQTYPGQDQGQYPAGQDQGQYPAGQDQGQYPAGQDQGQYPAGSDTNNCKVCPDTQNPNCARYCGNTVEHRNGPSTSTYPVSRKTIYEHRTKDVYPQQYVDIYPIEHVRIHPTNVVTRTHPVQRQIQYVGNHCQQQQSACGYGSQYFPTVSYGQYNQYYHYQSYQDSGRYRYFRYCRPRIFPRLFG